jgi:hypothetical protein
MAIKFHDRRTGNVVELQPGMRNILNEDGSVADVTDAYDPRADYHPGDHVARPELGEDPKYIDMMNKAGYSKNRRGAYNAPGDK